MEPPVSVPKLRAEAFIRGDGRGGTSAGGTAGNAFGVPGDYAAGMKARSSQVEPPMGHEFVHVQAPKNNRARRAKFFDGRGVVG